MSTNLPTPPPVATHKVDVRELAANDVDPQVAASRLASVYDPDYVKPQPPERYAWDPAWLDQFASKPYSHPDTFMPALLSQLDMEKAPRMLDVGGALGVMCLGWWNQQRTEVHVYDAWPPVTMMPRFVQGTLCDILDVYEPKEFTAVQCTEVLEHMPSKAEGRASLALLEQLAQRLLLITTPAGWRPQQIPRDGNPYNVHLTGWCPQELADLGFSVLINGQGHGAQIVAWKTLSTKGPR